MAAAWSWQQLHTLQQNAAMPDDAVPRSPLDQSVARPEEAFQWLSLQQHSCARCTRVFLWSAGVLSGDGRGHFVRGVYRHALARAPCHRAVPVLPERKWRIIISVLEQTEQAFRSFSHIMSQCMGAAIFGLGWSRFSCVVLSCSMLSCLTILTCAIVQGSFFYSVPQARKLNSTPGFGVLKKSTYFGNNFVIDV